MYIHCTLYILQYGQFGFLLRTWRHDIHYIHTAVQGREGLNRRYNCGSCSPWAALTHPRLTLLGDGPALWACWPIHGDPHLRWTATWWCHLPSGLVLHTLDGATSGFIRAPILFLKTLQLVQILNKSSAGASRTNSQSMMYPLTAQYGIDRRQ